MAEVKILTHSLFLADVEFIHNMAFESIRKLEEKAYAWMDGCLADAREVLCHKDQHILPKTPSAKQKSRRIRPVVDNETENTVAETETKSRTTRKRLMIETDSDTDCGVSSKPDKTPSDGRQTRASRAATTSRAKNTRATRNSKKAKSRSQEPICVIEDEIKNNPHVAVEDEMEVQEEIMTWTQSADINIIAPRMRFENENCRTPVGNRGVIDVDKTPVNERKTPLHQNFCKMNVKEKVHAYEEIILISPVASAVKKNKSKSDTPVKTDSPKTPDNIQTVSNTPDTVVPQTKTISVVRVSTDSGHSSTEDVPSVNIVSSAKKTTGPRLSVPKKALRKSLRTSLHVLPSKQRISGVHQVEVEIKPARTRTRLRLKKKEKKTEEVEADSDNETEQSNVPKVTSPTPDIRVSSPATDNTEDQMETDEPDAAVQVEKQTHPETEKRKTRSDTRKSFERPAIEPDTEEMEIAAVVEESTQPTRSTRTKTRAAQKPSESSDIERASSQDSAVGESTSSVEGESGHRMTRSKMRKPKVAEVIDLTETDTVFVSPSQPPPGSNSTRTKNRKRQHEEESDSEGQIQRPKRSCTSKMSGGSAHGFKTPTNTTTDTDSSDGDVLSPSCPSNKVVRPHPHSFLNSLNKNTNNPIRPANLNTGGLVKSFISRNSPAPKQTMKEIQEKRKKDLMEKQKQETERMKKRDEENKKKMEEMRKKREERARKVQELREKQIEKEKQVRIQLEKNLAEKRQKTMKQREERMKEEKEKQRTRLQKMEEAEERRKQEEIERQKKLKEQLEQEKFHEDMMQRKREYEEQKRQQKIDDEKRLAAERLQEMEKEREKERDRMKKQEEEKKIEWQKKREERERQMAAERAEKERIELEKKRERDAQLRKEMERIREQERQRVAEQERLKAEEKKRDLELKKMVDKHNNQVQQVPAKPALPKPNLNRTHSIEATNTSQNNNSYELTPDRVHVMKTAENYGIDELDSGDETDNEDAPRKKIPDWAKGTVFQASLIKQHYRPPDLDKIFTEIDPPDLNVLFSKKKARFNKRTSSAHWDSPILKPGLLGRV